MVAPLADVIVVLGARVLPDGRLGEALRRRVDRAAQAFAHGLAPRVLCTGGRRWNGHVEAFRMRDELVMRGVDPSAIWVEAFARCTADNAHLAAVVARTQKWRRLLVVTCPWHLPRAAADFQRCGLSVIGLPSPRGPASRATQWWRRAVESGADLVDARRLRARYRK